MGLARPDDQRPQADRPVPPGVVARPLPDRDRAARGRRPGRGPARRELPLPSPAEARRRLPAELDRRRQGVLDRRPARPVHPARSCWPGSSATPAQHLEARTQGSRRDPSGSAPSPSRSAGRTRAATAPRPLPPRSPVWSARRTWPATNGHRAIAQQATSESPTAGSASIKKWTLTTNGPLSDQPYFLRITKDGKPNLRHDVRDRRLRPRGDRPASSRRSVVPRAGPARCAPAHDRAIRNTIEVVDKHDQEAHPEGPFWHRFSFDGYGETAGGGDWVIQGEGTPKTYGRLWPLLTGERGEYAHRAGRRRCDTCRRWLRPRPRAS